jgi:hypothetical protein
MALELIEAAVDALDTYLETNLPAKITVLNARYADTVILDDIAEWFIGAMPPNAPKFPALIIVAQNTEPKRIAINSPTLTIDNDIEIIVVVGSEKIEERFRRLARYAVGIVELLQSGQAAYGYRYSLTGAIALSDVMSTPPFLQGISIPIRLSRTESF